LFAIYLAQVRGSEIELGPIVDEVANMSAKVDLVLDTAGAVKELAARYATSSSVLFIGRHVGYPVALEGALKLKELAYMHAEGFAAGELKHGPIALLEAGLPVFVIVPSPSDSEVLHEKIVSNIQEVRARGAETIVIAEEGDEAVTPYADHIIRVPAAPTLLQPLLTAVPLQMFAAEMAKLKGFDVDQPRNLAKSVTVE
jgi:glucosamine--fructose-6-phosphate aminotransferase (isomerizing)